MTDSPMVSERSVVLRERMADAKARCEVALVQDILQGITISHVGRAWPPCSECVSEAALRYPLPKVERPRTLVDGKGVEWRVIAPGRIECRRGSGDWKNPNVCMADFTVERALLIADLHGCPTEWVEEEG